MIRSLVSAIGLLVVCGCTTDVVDFPRQSRALDMFPGGCKLKGNKLERCWYCPAPGGDAWSTTCEKLFCELDLSDGGQAGCKSCLWTSTNETCKICWDGKGATTVDTCTTGNM